MLSRSVSVCLSGKRVASLFAGIFQPAYLNVFSSHATTTVVFTSQRFPARNALLPKMSFLLHFTPAEGFFLRSVKCVCPHVSHFIRVSFRLSVGFGTLQITVSWGMTPCGLGYAYHRYIRV